MKRLANHRLRRSRRSAGFTLIELLIAMLVLGMLMAGVFSIFDVSNRMASVQTQITDMQQSLRAAQLDIGRYARMAGRGGLPATELIAASPFWRGLAVAVTDNVPQNTHITTDPNSPLVLTGTDILTVRGCYGSLLQVDATSGGDFTRTVVPGGEVGTVSLWDPSPAGLSQDVSSLDGTTLLKPLLLVSPADESIYTVAQITAVNDVAKPDGTPGKQLGLNFSVANPYLTLAGNVLNPDLRAVSWACVLEEYRYYVREEHTVPADPTSPLAPKLSRAMMDPGTESPFEGDNSNLGLELADNIFDLQIAMAFDSDYPSGGGGAPGAFGDDPDFVGNDDIVYDGTADGAQATDDWLYNNPRDRADADQWWRHAFAGNTSPVALQYLRVNLLGRTDQPDGRYRAPLLAQIEDRDYTVALAGAPDLNSEGNLRFRRRLLLTVIDLRNL